MLLMKKSSNHIVDLIFRQKDNQTMFLHERIDQCAVYDEWRQIV